MKFTAPKPQIIYIFSIFKKKSKNGNISEIISKARSFRHFLNFCFCSQINFFYLGPGLLLGIWEMSLSRGVKFHPFMSNIDTSILLTPKVPWESCDSLYRSQCELQLFYQANPLLWLNPFYVICRVSLGGGHSIWKF